jgi:hypothetical protein
MADAGFFSKGGTGSDILGAVPYVTGGLGLIQGLFGDSEAETRRKRQEALKKTNEMYRTLALQRASALKQGAIKDISANTQTQLGRTQSDVARRVAALGRASDTESMLLPAAANISEAGGNTLSNALQFYDTQQAGINNQFDTNAMNIASDIAASPIEPSILDQLMGVGSSVAGQINYDKFLGALNQYGKTPTVNPNYSGSPVVPYTAPSSVDVLSPEQRLRMANFSVRK